MRMHIVEAKYSHRYNLNFGEGYPRVVWSLMEEQGKTWGEQETRGENAKTEQALPELPYVSDKGMFKQSWTPAVG